MRFNKTKSYHFTRQAWIIMLFSSILTQVSCSKKAEIADLGKPAKLYDVKLSVNTFSTEISNLSSKNPSVSSSSNPGTVNNAITDQINQLEYMIYNGSGVLVKNATQIGALSTFGTINEQLPAGS